MEKPIKGFFITLEGGEGSGKSTILKKLAEGLTAEGLSVVQTFAPGGSEVGTKIRQWLLEKDHKVPLDPMAELMLFLADRAQHIHEVIRPALEEGKIVLCDRFTDSTVAYQGFGRGMDVPRVQEICDLVAGYVQPFMTILLDVDPATGLKRALKETGEMDRIESETLEFHQQLHRGFHWLHEQDPERISLVDANQPLDHVYEEVYGLVKNRLSEYV